MVGEERMAVRAALSPLAGLIWELLIHVVREIIRLSRKTQGISETSGCGNHVSVIFMFDVCHVFSIDYSLK